MNDEKQEFIDLMEQAAGRRAGFTEFMEWLEDSDFFTAPASSKHHGAARKMLLRHSLNVRARLMRFEAEYLACGGNCDSLTVAALLHDVCKVGRYKHKPEGGFEVVSDGLPIGHGERSVIMIQQHGLTLTLEEIVAIRWHMGAFDDAFRGGCRDLNEAFNKYPLAVMLHLADMEASYLDEVRG